MGTRTSARTFAAAGITAAASTLTALSAGPAAHADVVGPGMTLQGSNFQVGQAYNVVVPISGCQGPQLSDTSGGVTVRPSGAITSNPPAGTPCAGNTFTWTYSWTPLTPGTHVLGIGWGNGNGSADFPPNTDLGTITVQVGGAGSTDPKACGDPASSVCTTVHGTAEVGCTLTVTMSGIPASVAASSGSGLLPSLSGGAARNAWFFDNATSSAKTPISGTTVTTKWTPTTAGSHHLASQYDTGAQSSIFSDGGPLPGSAGDMWIPVAAAGSQPCA